eukprot:scaffold12388_cov122-Isochrysis_galbana.AAC.8
MCPPAALGKRLSNLSGPDGRFCPLLPHVKALVQVEPVVVLKPRLLSRFRRICYGMCRSCFLRG